MLYPRKLKARNRAVMGPVTNRGGLMPLPASSLSCPVKFDMSSVNFLVDHNTMVARSARRKVGGYRLFLV